MPDWFPVPTLTLNNGVVIPQLGYGTFRVLPEQTQRLVEHALAIGYRHIDTAQMYRNEAEVGAATQASGIARAELFVTTKLNNAFHAYDDALREFQRSLEALRMDYVDLFLIHWPLPAIDKYVEAWNALEHIYADGRARAIGVSNFQPAHLERIIALGGTVPAVNQIEAHPYLQQTELRAFNSRHHTLTEAWSPLGRGTVLADPVIVEIAKRLGVTPAQVVLRWHLQRGDVIFPKSVTPARIEENFALFEFSLSSDDIAAIDSSERNGRVGSHPDTMNRTDR